jgi:hypothetical protein
MNPKPPKLKMPAALVIAMFRWLVPTITQCHKNAAGDGMAAYKTAILILSQGVRNSPSFRSWMPESSAQGWQATRYGKPIVNVRLHVLGRPTSLRLIKNLSTDMLPSMALDSSIHARNGGCHAII